MVYRKIVKIDGEKCTGCGLCVTACAEGALRIVDGKAKLVSDVYCDGLGACIGECPEGAIIVEEREAAEFNEAAVEKHLSTVSHAQHAGHCDSHSCPSAQVQVFEEKPREKGVGGRSMLIQWPVQLRLVPIKAPFFDDADLLIAADCVPFAYAGFHGDFLRGKTLLIGCPKLDNAEFYRDKLTRIFKQNNVRSLAVVNMEVPCCNGLYRLVEGAVNASGKTIPVTQHVVSVKGDLVKRVAEKGSKR